MNWFEKQKESYEKDKFSYLVDVFVQLVMISILVCVFIAMMLVFSSCKAKASSPTRLIDSLSSIEPLGTLTIKSTQAEQSSNYVTVNPYVGTNGVANDYVIWNVNSPNEWKAFGLNYNLKNSDGSYTTPMATVQFQGIKPGQALTCQVAALDSVCPASPDNLYTGTFSPAYPVLEQAICPGDYVFGFNAGCPPWQNNKKAAVVNAQGPIYDSSGNLIVPHVLAISAPFTVSSTGVLCVPSSSNSSAIFATGFADSATFGPVYNIDPANGRANQILTAANKTTWTLTWSQAAFGFDFQYNSIPGIPSSLSTACVMNGHFMDTLFDGGSPSTNNPLHESDTYFGISPNSTISCNNGSWFHAACDVTAAVPWGSNRKETQFFLYPGGDAPQNFNIFGSAPLNNSNQAIDIEVASTQINGYQCNGPAAPSLASEIQFAGSLGQGINWTPRSVNGTPDLMFQFDIWLRPSFNKNPAHLTFFQNSEKLVDCDLPYAVNWNSIGINFGHKVYHSALFVQEEQVYDRGNVYQLQIQPNSDVDHWDNMGIERLPASTIPYGTHYATFNFNN